jgi:hypothetical protein
MMIQRHRRRLELFPIERDALIEALRVCRKAVIESHRHLHPWSPTYRAGEPVLKAIDDLAGELTGDRKMFWAKSSTH